MTVEKARADDLKTITQIENSSFADPWSENSIVGELNCEDTHFTVCREGDVTVGFCVMRIIGEEAEIFDIAVKKEYRRTGAGRAMLDEAVRYGVKCGVEKFFLEVRESNTAAFSLYVSAGFKAYYVRKNYYSAPKENAILMVLERNDGCDNNGC